MPWTPLPRKAQGKMPTTQAILPTTQNHFDWAGLIEIFSGIQYFAFFSKIK